MRNATCTWAILAGILTLLPARLVPAVVIDQMDSADFSYCYDFDDGLR